jgi:hypothetical protein
MHRRKLPLLHQECVDLAESQKHGGSAQDLRSNDIVSGTVVTLPMKDAISAEPSSDTLLEFGSNFELAFSSQTDKSPDFKTG